MQKKRIIFMGTPEISSFYLKSLINNQHNIIAVFSQPPKKKGRGMILQNSPVHEIALNNKIDIFTPINFNSINVIEDVKKLKPDLIIIMGYGIILPKSILQIPLLGCFNIHISLLPRWRGAAPIEHTLINGDKITGVTIFKLVEEMDAGPIIAQENFLIDNNINKTDLTKKLNLIGVKLLNSILPEIFNNKLKFKNQNIKKITYAKKISTEMRKINFEENVINIHNKIRAFSPNPGAWFLYNNERIKIIKSSYDEGNWKPSVIINSELNIGCKFGKICPEIVQREGKKPLHIKEFLKGFKFTVGNKVNA